jgi:hypothetical protein
MLAKVWLRPVRVARWLRFGAHELRRVQAVVTEHEEVLLEAWHAYFGE